MVITSRMPTTASGGIGKCPVAVVVYDVRPPCFSNPPITLRELVMCFRRSGLISKVYGGGTPFPCRLFRESPRQRPHEFVDQGICRFSEMNSKEEALTVTLALRDASIAACMIGYSLVSPSSAAHAGESRSDRVQDARERATAYPTPLGDHLNPQLAELGPEMMIKSRRRWVSTPTRCSARVEHDVLVRTTHPT